MNRTIKGSGLHLFLKLAFEKSMREGSGACSFRGYQGNDERGFFLAGEFRAGGQMLLIERDRVGFACNNEAVASRQRCQLVDTISITSSDLPQSLLEDIALEDGKIVRFAEAEYVMFTFAGPMQKIALAA